jgi:hypothetical protein
MLACIVYAMLATWSIALMQAAAARQSTPAATLSEALKASICNSGVGQASPSDASSGPDQPTDQPASCSVCKAIAGCQLALPSTASPSMPIWRLVTVHFAVTRDDAVASIAITQRSRGPPALV